MSFSSFFSVTGEGENIQHVLWKHLRLDSKGISQCIKEPS